jgi:diguanylate cyclase (GGDEF)-like protein
MKKINDDLGHGAGDSALKDTAGVLRETFRDSDIIARIGGDEFAVMAVESAEVTAKAFVSRLLENLGTHNSTGRRPYDLSLSMGIAHYNPDNPCPIQELLEMADDLMYEHKRTKQKA